MAAHHNIAQWPPNNSAAHHHIQAASQGQSIRQSHRTWPLHPNIMCGQPVQRQILPPALPGPSRSFERSAGKSVRPQTTWHTAVEYRQHLRCVGFARVLACLSSLAGVDCRIRLHPSCQANYGQHWHAKVWTINVFIWPEAGVVTMKLCTKARVNTDA